MLAVKALDIAISQIGKAEEPIGSNWGHPVQEYLASVGINFPASWCMAFMYWCFNEAAKSLNVENPLVKTGGVLTHWQKAKAEYKIVKDPKGGDIFIQDHGHGLGHTGMVERVKGDFVYTIEGNTNDTGSREGFEVCRRVRKKSNIIGYLRY